MLCGRGQRARRRGVDHAAEVLANHLRLAHDLPRVLGLTENRNASTTARFIALAGLIAAASCADVSQPVTPTVASPAPAAPTEGNAAAAKRATCFQAKSVYLERGNHIRLTVQAPNGLTLGTWERHSSEGYVPSNPCIFMRESGIVRLQMGVTTFVRRPRVPTRAILGFPCKHPVIAAHLVDEIALGVSTETADRTPSQWALGPHRGILSA